MRRPESHFDNHPGVRSGIFYFLILLFLLQGIKWGVSRGFRGGKTEVIKPVDPDLKSRLDTIRRQLLTKRSWTLRPLNPNYLEDYRGYLLGIPFAALDSLYIFKSRGGVLTEMEQFQRITGLADSTCLRLAPFFLFPEPNPKSEEVPGPKVMDLNTATADQFRAVRGIGPVLSKRIVRFREALGGFVSAEQLMDVYGLSPEIAILVADTFPLRTIPEYEKVDLNRASVKELSEILYLNWQMASDIVAYRTDVGMFRNLEELRKVKSLPKDRIDRIALYLQL